MPPIVDVHAHYIASDPKSVDNWRRLAASEEIHAVVVCALDLRLKHSDAFPFMTTFSTTNEQLAEMIAAVASPKLIPFCYVDPRKKNAPREVERWITKEGMRGVKLYPPQGWYPDEPRVLPTFQAAEALGVPVLIHMGRVAPHPGLRSKYARPIRLEDVGLACPKIKLIIGHSGCPWQWESFRLADGFPGFYLDLTTSGSLDMQMLRLIAEDPSTGVRRLLLGTDGNGSNNVRIAMATLARLRAGGFTDDQLDAVAHRNAAAFLGIM